MRRLISLCLTFISLTLLASCSKINTIHTNLSSDSSQTDSASSTAVSEVTHDIPIIPIENNNAELSSDKLIRIAFGGDTFMDMVFAEYSDLYGVDYPWSDIAPVFNNSDIGFVNLETSVSRNGESLKREGYGFRTSPDKLEGYKNAGISIVSGANNHIQDYGAISLTDTMKHLDTYKISYTGIGNNLGEARRPVFFESEGIRVGFLAYTEIIPFQSWTATDNTAGFCGITNETLPLYLEDIKKYDAQCDILIVSVHWGIEHTQKITNYQQELAHKFIDSGADMILGHHPHVLQPIEFYKEKPIFYSLGNLLFLKQDDFAGRTAVFRAEFNKDGFVSAKMFPVYIKACKANMLSEDSLLYNNILANMSEISAQFGTGISKYGEITPFPCDNPPVYIKEPDDSSDNSGDNQNSFPDIEYNNLPETVDLYE